MFLAAFLEQQEDLLTLTSGAPYEIQAINRDPRQNLSRLPKNVCLAETLWYLLRPFQIISNRPYNAIAAGRGRKHFVNEGNLREVKSSNAYAHRTWCNYPICDLNPYIDNKLVTTFKIIVDEDETEKTKIEAEE
ncbi:hypothetical protein WISP_108288 [Willisornis vidua]|uniref:Uncharacterized protein n=1 Tax=Willisornis vidua TaxID=1566151 RepID=A0ABQ9D2D5_9PASS|nr:hypothetical protein WISP_108288 [Willisornis vidua]